MGFLRRVFGSGEPAPEWASFFSGDEYRAFIAAVEADLGRRGRAFTIRDGYVELEAQGDDEAPELGLANLAQMCNALEQSDWSLQIASHFSAVFATQGRDFDAIAADFEQARPILRIRLFPDASMGGTDLGDTVSRPLAPGILEALVYDFPDSVAGVLGEHLAAWPVGEDAAMLIARANTTAEPATRAVTNLDGMSFDGLEGGMYTASHVFDLTALLPPDNQGAIVTIPNRHTLVWYPIVDASAGDALTRIIAFASLLFEQGPGSISNQLYWWRNGDLIHIPIDWRRGPDIFPPDELMAVLNALSESETAR
jgi:hypothetical protein